jgi:pyrophosphatase PpaX
LIIAAAILNSNPFNSHFSRTKTARLIGAASIELRHPSEYAMASNQRAKNLFLDLDGTVVDTHELIFQCYDRTMRDHCGCEGSRAVLEQCAGLHLNDIFSATMEHFGVPITTQVITEAIAIYRAHLRASESAVTTFPGVRDCLIELSQRGWRLAIVTTKPREAALRHLQSQDLAHLFATVVAGDECTNLKPHPEPFLKALDALGVHPADAVGVGDSEHDIHSARAAGLKTVGACWGTISRTKLIAAQPDLLAEHPCELLEL